MTTETAASGGGASLHVLIGLKRLDTAKQRLALDLSCEERRQLMLHMLTRVVRQAHAAALGPVALATSEPTAREIVAELGIDAVSDGDLPWNQGLVHALERIRPRPGAVLYLAGDLPLVSAAELRGFVAAAPQRGVAIARARDGGTNALLVRPAGVMQPMFGHRGSSAVHAARAEELGLAYSIVDLPGLALDVDTVVDARDSGVLRDLAGLAATEATAGGS